MHLATRNTGMCSIPEPLEIPMTATSAYLPGQEVRLASGVTGVLYARTWRIRRAHQSCRPATWYFLPDGAGASGLVVWSQPNEICESEVAWSGPVREGSWPASHYRLAQAQRQAVYVAHMQRRSLPAAE